jgi:hypothetical protein
MFILIFIQHTHKKRNIIVCVEGDYNEIEWKCFFV